MYIPSKNEMFWDGYAVSDNGVSINKVLWDDYK
jgi:hypothetical protein